MGGTWEIIPDWGGLDLSSASGEGARGPERRESSLQNYGQPD